MDVKEGLNGEKLCSSSDTGYSTEKDNIFDETLNPELGQDMFVICSMKSRNNSPQNYETKMNKIGTLQSNKFFVEKVGDRNTLANRKVQYFINYFFCIKRF